MTEAGRTWLYAPGDRPDRCVKALASQADQVIWDLEDAVAPVDKGSARRDVCRLLETPLTRDPWIRINGLDTPWGLDDLQMLSDAWGDHEPGWVVPKADGRTIEQLAALNVSGRWLLIIETARGLLDALHARDPWPVSGPARLAFGALDYRYDAGLDEHADEQELAVGRQFLALISRGWQWPGPIDAVLADFQHLERVEDSARRGRALGMTGKMIIHPRQIVPVHAAYRPSTDDVHWAQAVLKAAEGAGAVTVDGAMVDRPIIERAKKILRDAGQGDEAAPG